MDAEVEGLSRFLSTIYTVSDLPYKKNGWRTSSGKVVSNKDLFCTLDEAISALERRHLDVGFWWIDREVHVAIFI